MPRPRIHDEPLRQRLLEAAARRLSEQGPHALGLRAIAAEVDTSTTAVYSLFGGKPGLLRELYIEAFSRLQRHLRAVPESDDPTEDLVRLGLAYRESARVDPYLYSIMFGKPLPGFEPDDEACRYSDAAFESLLTVVRRGVAGGTFVGESAESIALGAWAMVHGMVSLELGGNLPADLDIAANYERLLRRAVTGLRGQ